MAKYSTSSMVSKMSFGLSLATRHQVEWSNIPLLITERIMDKISRVRKTPSF